jgi:hypothetical protein
LMSKVNDRQFLINAKKKARIAGRRYPGRGKKKKFVLCS